MPGLRSCAHRLLGVLADLDPRIPDLQLKHDYDNQTIDDLDVTIVGAYLARGMYLLDPVTSS